jgi:hypothetical protein
VLWCHLPHRQAHQRQELGHLELQTDVVPDVTEGARLDCGEELRALPFPPAQLHGLAQSMATLARMQTRVDVKGTS